MALRAVLMFNKDKHLSAKRGKQWGKHCPHLATFLCTRLHHQNAESIANTAFHGIVKNCEDVKLVPSGPQKMN